MSHSLHFVVCVILASFIVTSSARADALSAPLDVFTRGKDLYPAYRIPSIAVTQKGTLLAFAEGRTTLADHAENKIVLKRSTDQGLTWADLQVVADVGKNCLNNPCVLVHSSGKIILMYQHYPEKFGEHGVKAGLEGPDTCLNFLTTSEDDGVTWSTPVDITRQSKHDNGATSIASGPGNGIELTRGPHKGRIVFPMNEGPAGKWQVYATYSDDLGKTWKAGKNAPAAGNNMGNEVQMVELADGSVMLNSRGEKSVKGSQFRQTATSADGGETWSPLTSDENLPEPVCQASLIRYSFPESGKPGLLVYSGPGTQGGRRQGTIRISDDEGKSWKYSRVIKPGGFAYSALVKLPDGSIGCFYEREGYQGIVFQRFTIDWVMEKP